MLPLDRLPADNVRRLRGVLFDLDDTVLDGGVLGEEAYGALWRLRRAGMGLVLVTGRPSGWGEVLVRTWPVDAALVENGGLALAKDGATVIRLDAAGPDERSARQARLRRTADDLLAAFPEARVSDDSGARVTDVALDVGETRRLPAATVGRMEAAARAMGVRTFVSTVHLHLTLEAHDKATGAIALLVDRFGEDASAARARWAWIGDSANDASCFAAFSTTCGVANVAAAARALTVPPRWVASRERGAGFAEIADRILALRAGAGA